MSDSPVVGVQGVGYPDNAEDLTAGYPVGEYPEQGSWGYVTEDVGSGGGEGGGGEGEIIPVEISATVNGLTVTLDYTGSGVENGCEVFWGDGTGPYYPGPGGTSEGPPLEYTYAAPGTYTITVDPLGEEYVLASYDVEVTGP
jgi:hypothetical protein